MIEGMKVTIKGPMLRKYCLERVEYHERRCATYAKQIRDMEAAKVEGMTYTNGDPIRSLKDQLAKHEGELGEMKFIADHLDLDESYILNQSDLHKLGVCKSQY